MSYCLLSVRPEFLLKWIFSSSSCLAECLSLLLSMRAVPCSMPVKPTYFGVYPISYTYIEKLYLGKKYFNITENCCSHRTTQSIINILIWQTYYVILQFCSKQFRHARPRLDFRKGTVVYRRLFLESSALFFFFSWFRTESPPFQGFPDYQAEYMCRKEYRGMWINPWIDIAQISRVHFSN